MRERCRRTEEKRLHTSWELCLPRHQQLRIWVSIVRVCVCVDVGGWVGVGVLLIPVCSIIFSHSHSHLNSFSHSLLSPSLSSLPGVKEAFLKVAQGVITLYQKNQLTPNTTMDPSFSPVSSYSYPQQPIDHAKQSAYFYTTHSVEANGHVMVDSRLNNVARRRRGSSESGDLEGNSKCCS